MAYYLTKVAMTAVLVVLISEVAKRSSLVGAVLASVPLVSVLAMIWLYIDTRDVGRVSSLATSVFWLVIPSLALFVALPLLLRRGVQFYLALPVSIAVTVGCYVVMVAVLERFGVRL
jgi:hypothetical protein